MESSFPSNSQTQKASPSKKEEKKVERVTRGEVIQRKKSLGTRFKETFISGADSKSVLEYVLFDILVPAAKDMVVDATQAGLERKFYGETRSAGRRGYNRANSIVSGAGGYQAYNRMGGSVLRSDPRAREEVRPSRRSRAKHDFGEIVMESRAEANEVLDALFELISKFEVATVADLYELTGIPAEFTDNRWGWEDLRGADVVHVRDGYLLELPQPVAID